MGMTCGYPPSRSPHVIPRVDVGAFRETPLPFAERKGARGMPSVIPAQAGIHVLNHDCHDREMMGMMIHQSPIRMT